MDEKEAKRGPSKVIVGQVKPFRFNVMVVGESGQGKTTFLKALMRKYVDNPQSISLLEARTTSTVEISEIGSFVVDADIGQFEVYLHDTPGYGDYINNKDGVDLIRKFLDDRHRNWRNLDVQAMTFAERNQADTRIHCAFYFIASHRMKAIDVEFISQISSLVPIIPIIAKADTMTFQERQDFLCTVYQKLQSLNSASSFPVTYDFGEEGKDFISDNDAIATLNGDHAEASFANVGRTLASDNLECSSVPETDGMDSTPLPKIRNIFAVVCDNSPSSCRSYPWGRLQINDERHSDFRRLQRLIFEEGRHIQGLIEDTQARTIASYAHTSRPSPPTPSFQLTDITTKMFRNRLKPILLPIVLLMLLIGLAWGAHKYTYASGVASSTSSAVRYTSVRYNNIPTTRGSFVRPSPSTGGAVNGDARCADASFAKKDMPSDATEPVVSTEDCPPPAIDSTNAHANTNANAAPYTTTSAGAADNTVFFGSGEKEAAYSGEAGEEDVRRSKRKLSTIIRNGIQTAVDFTVGVLRQ